MSAEIAIIIVLQILCFASSVAIFLAVIPLVSQQIPGLQGINPPSIFKKKTKDKIKPTVHDDMTDWAKEQEEIRQRAPTL